jgi:hypothetical protein
VIEGTAGAPGFIVATTGFIVKHPVIAVPLI